MSTEVLNHNIRLARGALDEVLKHGCNTESDRQAYESFLRVLESTKAKIEQEVDDFDQYE